LSEERDRGTSEGLVIYKRHVRNL